METAIIIATVWVSLLILYIWVNHRFHRSYIAKSDPEFIFTNSIATERDYNWSGELRLSKGQ